MVLTWAMSLFNVLAPSPPSQPAYFSVSIDVIVPENGEPVGTREIKCCIRQIQELIISRLNQAVANKLTSSVDYLRESFVGTLERCLQSLEKSQDVSVHITSNNLKQVLQGCSRCHVTWCTKHPHTSPASREPAVSLQLVADPGRILIPCHMVTARGRCL